MDRRGFLGLLQIAGLGWVSIRVTGCGEASSNNSTILDEPTVTMQDLRMEGWSIYGSGFLGANGTLKASAIAANAQLELDYIQDPHGHRFTITKEHLLSLRKGQSVKIITTEALGHRHEVRIDPRNVVQNSQSITMTIDPDASPPPEAAWYAALNNTEAPHLHVATSAAISGDEALTFCVSETETGCAADSATWLPFRKAKEEDRRQFLSSLSPLKLEPDKDYFIDIRRQDLSRPFRFRLAKK